MDNEGLITYLAFLEYSTKGTPGKRVSPDSLDVYKAGKINIRLAQRSKITQVLDKSEEKAKFLSSCVDLDEGFIKKVKTLVSGDDGKEDSASMRAELDNLFAISKLRSYQSFYILWLSLLNISYDSIVGNKQSVKADVRRIMSEFRTEKDVQSFLDGIADFQAKYA